VRALLWFQGMSRAQIQHVEQDLAQAAAAPRVMAAVAFARSQSRSGPAAATAARETLRHSGYSAAEIREVAFVAAQTDFSNRAHTIPAIPARSLERMPDRLYMRLLRPLLGRIVRKRRYRGEATPVPAATSGPYAGVVSAYAGSPISLLLGRTLAEMWASPHLTRRCKLLMMAVVAWGLESDPRGMDLGLALEQEGVGETLLGRILAKLDARELDAVERLLVPFARETIWYEPVDIQRHARALRKALRYEELIEAIGVAALANALCRLSATMAADA
jgi:alkylhydroperoxidase family enzyme